ncbi:filamentous hemagglutinin N-terminal domain-containing protein [Dolichospermum circinale CS-541/06]|uniref:beta strand repeat-containing protein n=3 Tax=Dolichospermum circinale TaxID=109265 RepID=UPI00232E6D5C|nr:filamentous hemagglutinin N-terminal domain-containing protein [Dolichospermum circinale]MDB9454666.1 filamentous hemagglutinin N-terminal domain-containing protein [Dolichospermum circinale CS-541/06]
MKLNLSGTTLIQQLILQIITGLIVAANTGIVKAQLTPDNTVGSTTRSDTVKGLTSDIIEGGATRGTNLFHSFTNFNVDAGKGVYFSNPADINNILTRVTGSSQSNIFGTLGVLGNANLFLINPNGISFGPNAQLDVKGSFVASTADKIVFDNYQFTTTNPTAPPLLTVNIPLGLGFRDNPGDINIDLKGSTLAFNNGQGLKVPQDKTLALIGGNVNINGNGVDAEGLRAGILSPGSQIQLGGLTQTGTVNFNENFYSTFPQGVTRGNVSLSNGAEINVRAAGGGSITINSRNLNVNEDSRVRAGIQKNLGSVNAQAGNIDINNIEQVTIDNAVIANIVDEFGKGNAGDINIHTSSLTLKNGSTINTSVFAASSEGNAGNVTIDTANLTLENGNFISADTSGKGNAGNVAIQATEGVNVRGWLSSDVKGTAQGNSGGITIDTANLTLENGGYISADTYGKGNAGNIAIQATEGVTVGGFLTSGVFDTGVGDSGGITIDTSTLTLENGGFISTTTFGKGNAGNIAIQATERVTVRGLLTSGVFGTGEGDSGGITIDTSTLTLENDGIISTTTFGKGNAGNIAIQATEGVTVGGLLSSGVDDTGVGNSGGITIDTSTLTLENDGIISADTYGKGNAGNIAIKANQGVNVRGGLSSDVKNTAQGNSGGITIDTSTLTLENGGRITAITSGKGNAGNIAIQATERVTVRGLLTSGVFGTGEGDSGGITIDTATLTLENGGFISTTTYGKGNAGNIVISAYQGVTIGGYLSSGVFNTGEGDSGGITIDTSTLTLENGGFINASTSGKGNAGNVAIQATQGVTVGGFLTSGVFDTGVGNSGGITIDTSTLTLENGGIISADTSGKGNAGNIVISAYQGVTIGGYLSSGVFDTGVGDSGGITIKAGDINIKGVGDNNITSQINTATSGKGNAGDINISASNITIDQGVVYSSALGDGEGKGGNININTSNLTLKNGYISTETTSKGDAGNIQLGITDNLKLTNSTISSGTDSTGKAGSINIDPKFYYYNSCIVWGCITAIFISEYNVSTLIELDSSEITVKSQGSGDGGNITLTGDNLNLNNSTISASTKSGQGGNITLNIPDTIRQNNSKIEASAGENGNGGNVTIKTNFIIGNGGNISANATQGAGGNIKITTQGIFGYKGKQIDASSETGVDGVVETNTPEVDPSQGLIDLPENLLTAAIVTNSCRQGQNSQNSLIVKGRGGLALTSDQLSSSSEVEVDLIAPTSVKSSSAINPTSTNMEKTAFKTIIPAQGWEINSQGDVVLVAHSTGNPAERVNTAITCASN